MTPAVTWFKHGHEQRNYWLRHGLMRLHLSGVLRYRERPLVDAVQAGFTPVVTGHEHRHTSLILVNDGKSSTRCIVDSEDSFLCMAGIIHEADRYFVSGYSRRFFEDKIFVPPYNWLEPHETAFYRQRAAMLVETQGAFFDRVRPFVPIAPNIGPRPVSRGWQRLRNLANRIEAITSGNLPWRFVLEDFEHRHAALLALRNRPAVHDVVLLDSLWGWPRHRVALHERLAELAGQGRDIRSKLNWGEPSHWDGSDVAPFAKASFPMMTGTIDAYEPMLAASRLAVFATGFHWGWRNIMTLALMVGLPVLVDRLYLEPWFDMSRFDVAYNDSFAWDDLGEHLAAVTDAERARIAAHNQAAFDELLAPEKVAEYFVTTALG